MKEENIGISNTVEMIFYTAAVGIIPIMLFTLFNYNNYLKNNLLSAQKLNLELRKKIKIETIEEK